uniref:Odorant receptor n=1 Tax=Eucryptorrhynchus scrobiculatus TaxID=1552824 RepID=A0A8F4RSL1_EUCSC|nr:odorant receptor 28 [Eucryptorrhynchus scrobiculatus]
MYGKQFMLYPKYLMLVCGVWRTPYFKNPIVQKLYRFCGFLVQGVYLLACVCMWIEFFSLLKMHDTKKIMDNIRTTASCLLVAVKVCIFQTGRFSKLLNNVIKEEQIVSSSNDEDTRKIHSSSGKNVYQFTVVIIGLSNVTAAFLLGSMGIVAVARKGDPSAEKPVIISADYLFDPNVHWGASLFLESVSAVLAAEYFNACQVIYISIMVFVKMQLRILQHRIRNFDCYKHADSTFIDDLQLIKLIIRSHQGIIRFVGELNEAIKLMLLVEFLFSSINIATSTVHLTVEQNMNDAAFSFATAIILTGQLLIFAWHANDINAESIKVSSALYEFSWYDKSKEMQKIVHVMILRSQRPLTLTIGPFKPLSNEVITQVINIAYSYITLMQSTY